MSDATVEAYLTVREEVNQAVRELYRHMLLRELVLLLRGDYKRMTLQPPTLVAFGRSDYPFTEQTVRHICRDHERRAAQLDFAFIENASHFITDDAPDAVAELAVDWFQRSGG